MARILAIHAGKIKSYTADGVAFDTAICKQAIHGPVTVTKSGIEGNEVANHKNALYAFCAENYVYWNEALTPNPPWQYGMVGENLTLEGIDESTVQIGDLFKIGAVTLQVSGCRAPCVNFLWRVKLPASFLRVYQESGRTGLYLEVLETGVIEAGDSVQHLSCVHDSISVPDLARFFLNPQPRAQELDRLLAVPGMGPQMLSTLTAARNLIIEKNLVQTNRWSGWRSFAVREIVQESRDIKSFYLEPADQAGGVAGYRAGQFLTVRVPQENGESMPRCWSISAYDETLNRYRISIKRELQGAASGAMHDRIKVGDVLDLQSPSGHFTLKRGTVAQPVVLISAGVGITPMVSMLHSHAARLDKNLPTLYFIHSTQDKQTHAFRAEVDAVVARYPQFQTHYIHSQPSDDSVSGQDFHSSARLNAATLERLFKDMGCWFSEKWIPVTPAECAYYLCGPEQFVRDVVTMLNELGVLPSNIYQESFAGGLGSLAGLQLPPAQVDFRQSLTQARWHQDDDLSLLELAERAGLRPEFSCRNGQCGLCRTLLLEGEIFYARQPSIELGANEVLLCCALPKGDVTLQA